MPRKNIDNDLSKELAYCKELERIIEKEPSVSSIPAVREKLNSLKETVEDTQENIVISKDVDAKIGHKSEDSSFFGYKTHIAMTEERIITAAVVTSGERGDGPELPKLLEMSQKNGIDVDTIIGDAAYSGKENIKLTSGQDIKVVAKLNPSIAQGSRKTKTLLITIKMQTCLFVLLATWRLERLDKEKRILEKPSRHLLL